MARDRGRRIRRSRRRRGRGGRQRQRGSGTGRHRGRAGADDSGVVGPAREVRPGPLLRLVSYLRTAKGAHGDATLVRRHQTYTDAPTVDDHDLYADNGDYFYGSTLGALPAKVKGHHTEGGDLWRREIAAAKYAVTGDLKEARRRMASAPNPSVKVKDVGAGKVPDASAYQNLSPEVVQGAEVNLTDNWIWGNSLDALMAGGGNPKVRAGVLRILANMPEVTIASGTTGGRSTISLTAGRPALTGDEVETLVIDARTGLPIQFTNNTGAKITYTATRVSLTDIAKGKF